MKILAFYKNRIIFTPLSLGGLILASSMFGLLLGPGVNSSDLLASTMASIFITLLAALGVLTLAVFINIRRTTTAFVFAKAINGKLTAGEPITVACTLNALKLLPFTRLKLQLLIDDPEIQLGLHDLKGRKRGELTLEESILLPHRGIWKIHGVRISVQDAAGLWNFSFNKSIPALTLKIEPPVRDSSSLEILSSIYTTGDTIPMGEKRAGDYYDLKAYAPTDGISRIAWKIFARRGELITRQPDKEVRPEGKALIFCLAGPNDDQICAEAQAYMKLLESMDLEIAFSCEGAPQNKFASNSSSALDLMIEAARGTRTSYIKEVGQELKAFLSRQIEASAGSLMTVLVFVGETRLVDQENSRAAELAILEVTLNNLEPVIICRDPNQLSYRTSSQQHRSKLAAVIQQILFVDVSSTLPAPTGLQQLIAASSRHSWNVLTCP